MVETTSGSTQFVRQWVTLSPPVTSGHGPIPDGELVTFFDGTAAIGTSTTASSVATFTTSSLKAKTHTIKATYGGGAKFWPRFGTITPGVGKNTTTTRCNTSPHTFPFGPAG